MSRVARLAGALLAETEGEYFLVGNLKRPCDFASAGFEPPPREIAQPGDGGAPASGERYLRLRRSGPLAVPGPWLVLQLEGEALARLLGERLIIARTGSVSDRLWRLILGGDPEGDPGGATAADLVVDSAWLASVPGPIWQIVRDTVLRCT
jgi:hypothetical protein